MNGRKRRVYALYEGDEYIDTGTAEELAARHGMRPQYIAWLSAPSSRKNGNLRKHAVKLGLKEPEVRCAVNLPEADRPVWDMHSEGMTVEEIASATGRSASSVRTIITGVWFDQNTARRARKWRR